VIRLFTAIDIPTAIQDSLHQLGREVRGARAVPADQLHLTLTFIGEVEDQRLQPIHQALAAIRRDALCDCPAGHRLLSATGTGPDHLGRGPGPTPAPPPPLSDRDQPYPLRHRRRKAQLFAPYHHRPDQDALRLRQIAPSTPRRLHDGGNPGEGIRALFEPTDTAGRHSFNGKTLSAHRLRAGYGHAAAALSPRPACRETRMVIARFDHTAGPAWRRSR